MAKIISICTRGTLIYGLGVDQKIYLWQYETDSWKLYNKETAYSLVVVKENE